MNIVFSVVFLCLVVHAWAHGRFIEPPSRTSAWRFGFGTPSLYDDHETNCGGFERQWEQNGGRCGVCGDPWDLPAPRDGESGGKYGLGVITRSYSPGQSIRVSTHITANHKGYFQFSLCPEADTAVPVTQGCLDRHLLRISSGATRYYLGEGTGTHSTEVTMINKNLFTTMVALAHHVSAHLTQCSASIGLQSHL